MTPESKERIEEYLRELEEEQIGLIEMAGAVTLCGFSVLASRLRRIAENVSRTRRKLDEEIFERVEDRRLARMAPPPRLPSAPDFGE